MTRSFITEQLDAGEASGEYPDVWYPGNPGDTLVGKLLRYDQNYAGKWLAILEEDETGREQAVWLSNRVLRAKFDELRPQVGEDLGIRYTGSKVGASGHTYKMFVLFVDRSDEAPATTSDYPPDDSAF